MPMISKEASWLSNHTLAHDAALGEAVFAVGYHFHSPSPALIIKHFTIDPVLRFLSGINSPPKFVTLSRPLITECFHLR